VEQIEHTVDRKTHTDSLVIKRKGQPEEAASLVAFLLGDESKYITGSIYSIDGGWSI
jgi:NAD(P)-dependent dehydrogenase (short-subunit alcohol dehydrogenase family)